MKIIVPGDLISEVRDLIKRVERIERSQSVSPQYTTAERPFAANEPGLIIFNLTTNKHQGSDGTAWQDMY